MKTQGFRCAALLFIAVAMSFSMPVTAESPETEAKSQVFELPRSIGPGEAREVSVLLDASHLKLATLTLRRGTVLPSHSAPVPTTIQVLEGEGIIYIGSEAAPVSRGAIVSLAAGEEHGVTPAAGSDLLLLIHYLRGGTQTPAPADPPSE